MCGKDSGAPATTERIEHIPLYLIPKTISDQVRKNGKAIFRITAVKTFQNRFTIIVESGDTGARPEPAEAPARTGCDGHG